MNLKAIRTYFKSGEVATWRKLLLFGALAYAVLPFDAVPDMLPLVGWLDDVGVLGFSAAMVFRASRRGSSEATVLRVSRRRGASLVADLAVSRGGGSSVVAGAGGGVFDAGDVLVLGVFPKKRTNLNSRCCEL